MPGGFREYLDLVGRHVGEQRLGLEQRRNMVDRLSLLLRPHFDDPSRVRERNAPPVKLVPNIRPYRITGNRESAGILRPVFLFLMNAGITKTYLVSDGILVGCKTRRTANRPHPRVFYFI